MNTAATVALSIAAMYVVASLIFVKVVLYGKKAQRYAVTLINNEGAFIGLLVKKRLDQWVFVDVRITPDNPGGPVMQAAPGELYVPRRNILYYQQIVETANVA